MCFIYYPDVKFTKLIRLIDFLLLFFSLLKLQTPMAGLYSSIMAVLSLTYLTHYFSFIPKATLASVLIIAVVFMVSKQVFLPFTNLVERNFSNCFFPLSILFFFFFSILQIDFKLPIHLWRKNRRDFIAWFICLAVCLFTDVEIGLMCGIVLNVLHLIYMWARPETVVRIDELDGMQYIHIIPNVGMFFPGIDHLRETVNKAASAAEYKVPAVIDCTKFNGLDYTSAQVYHHQNYITIIYQNQNVSM